MDIDAVDAVGDGNVVVDDVGEDGIAAVAVAAAPGLSQGLGGEAMIMKERRDECSRVSLCQSGGSKCIDCRNPVAASRQADATSMGNNGGREASRKAECTGGKSASPVQQNLIVRSAEERAV